VYSRRVAKRRPASLNDAEWLEVTNRGKCPRPDFQDRDGRDLPPVDVYDLVVERQLRDLGWRLESLMCAMAKPSTLAQQNGSSSQGVTPGALLSNFSEVWDFLTKPTYLDGSVRTTGTMSLKYTSGKLQVTLTDPTSATYCCQSGESLDDVLLALEIGLKEGTLPWRASGFAKGKK